MNHPEDFDRKNDSSRDREEPPYSSEEQSGSEGNAANHAEREEFPPIKEPQWYGVSYQGEHAYYPGNSAPVSTKKPKRATKIALVSLVVAACLVIALAAGFGGALIARISTPDTNEDPLNDALSTSGISGNHSEIGVYSSDGADAYDYASVAIDKNDGSDISASSAGSAGTSAKSLPEAVAMVQDSVVEITATATSVRGTVTAGAGSGVIIHRDGVIVTNNHVIDGFTDIYVIVTDHNSVDEDGNYMQYKYAASVRGTDEDGDVAILKINPVATLTVAKLGSSASVILAEEVFVIGNPLGELGGTVTNGIISSISRQVQVDDNVMTLLQTNAAINSGNSGGGLFNLAGELIGIVNAKYSATGVEGLGFAIPVDTAMTSIRDLLDYGYIRGIPSLGVTVADGYVSSGWYKIAVAYVYKAGDNALKANDIITEVAGQEVSSAAQVKSVISSYQVGDTVSVTVKRDGVVQTFYITLTEYVPS